MSVYGTGSIILILEAFLGRVLLWLRAGRTIARAVADICEERIYLSLIRATSTGIQLPAHSTTLRHSIEYYRSKGILTFCPSAATFVITLGPD